jgi:hypothetical protein
VLTDAKNLARSIEIQHAIESRILLRTGGRIQSLNVKVTGDHIVISGRTSCFYHKQLALQGVLDVTGAAGATFEFNVEVQGA